MTRARIVALDSAVFIYHLENVEPYSALTEQVISGLAEGAYSAVASTILAAEFFVPAFAPGREHELAALENFLNSLPNMTLAAATRPICRQAARLRQRHGIRTPDAIHVATALSVKAGAFLTNDAALRKVENEGIRILVLDDYDSTRSTGRR